MNPDHRLARTGVRDEHDRLWLPSGGRPGHAAVPARHRRVSGRLGEAVGPYPAYLTVPTTPELLLWGVLFTLVDSAIVVYERYVRPLWCCASRQASGWTTASGACWA